MMKNEEKKISIIIPLYKCEDFLSGLLDSVCGQSLKNIEIICVLDGPDENISKAVEDRAREDNRIICIEQEHGGAGAARNTGLQKARGKYLLFLDADDIFDIQMCEKMYEEAEKWNADTVMCSYTETNEWKKNEIHDAGYNHSVFPAGCIINPFDVQYLLSRFIGAPWNKLFRRKMIMDNNLQFSETRIMNDEFFVTAAVVSSKRIAVIHEDLLTVRRYINENSISSNRAKYTQDCILVMKQIYDWLVLKNVWENYKEGYYYKFRNALNYQASYDYNAEFIDGMARTLSMDEPWISMSNFKLARMLMIERKRIKRLKLNLMIKKLLQNASKDVGKKNIFRMRENQIIALDKIRLRMKNIYGRNIDEDDSPESRLIWRLRQKGVSGTVRAVLSKLKRIGK